VSELLTQRLAEKYEVLREIKRGGMGTIYLVRHRPLDVIRVVKVLRVEHRGDAEFKARFEDEARAAAKLQHPNVVRIHDFSIDEDGHGLLEMEYIQGVDLRHLISRERRLSLPLILEIARQCLAALDHLHEQGMVHRDVSPENFMLTRDTENRPLVKLIDLGVAKHDDRVGAATKAGTFLGKVRYASPEQFDAGNVGAASDLYSFGIVLYELLTGRFPIPGENVHALNLPRRLQEAVLRALEKRPEDRFASADEFAEEIRSLQEQLRLAEDDFDELSQVLAETDSTPMPRRSTHIDTEVDTATLILAKADPTAVPRRSDIDSEAETLRKRSASLFVVGPPIERDEDLFGFQAQRERLRDFLEGGQSVQILGGQRRGKTSLLKWIERHAPQWQRRPVVSINAQGLAGQSPADLVLAVANEVGRRDTAEKTLRDAGGSSAASARVLEDLLPLVLLIDEASVLAQPQHGFDVDFLGALRTFCQDFRLVWVSASFRDIRQLFLDTGLASRFLNDARVVWVGQLEEEAARRLVSRLDRKLVELTLREAGGFAYGLQWLGDSLLRDPSDPEASCDTFADEMRSVFDGWWRYLDAEDRKFLKRCVSGLARSELTDRHRRCAQRLRRQGLLTEDSGQFVLPGATWRNFVQDQ